MMMRMMSTLTPTQYGGPSPAGDAGGTSQRSGEPNAAADSFFGRIRRDGQKRATLYNDGILLVSLAYSALDIMFQWPEFQTCQKPVGSWLVGSYTMVMAFRVLNYVAQAYAPEGEDDSMLLHIRQPGTVPKVVAYFTWTVMLPFFVYWTVMGTFWVSPVLWHSRHACLPEGAHPWFVVFCQILCYFWVLLYTIYLMGILRFEYRLRRAEAALRSIETEDSIRRWGRQSFLQTENAFVSDQTSFAGSGLAHGLRPAEITELPLEKLCSTSALLCEQEECAICITNFRSGDSARRLPGCRHAFHRECIDLWLLRSAACPLCKTGVTTSML